MNRNIFADRFRVRVPPGFEDEERKPSGPACGRVEGGTTDLISGTTHRRQRGRKGSCMYILYPVTHPPKQNPGVVCVPLTPFALPSKQRVDGDRSQWSNVAHFPLPDRRGVGSVPRMGASAADHFREVNRRLGGKRRGQEGKTTRAPLDMANHRSAEGGKRSGEYHGLWTERTASRRGGLHTKVLGEDITGLQRWRADALERRSRAAAAHSAPSLPFVRGGKLSFARPTPSGHAPLHPLELRAVCGDHSRFQQSSGILLIKKSGEWRRKAGVLSCRPPTVPAYSRLDVGRCWSGRSSAASCPDFRIGPRAFDRR